MTELDKLLRSTEAMTELDRLLREIEGRADAANPWDGAAARIAADVPKLVKALRRAMGTLRRCSVTLADIEAILKETL